jgi:hypothetical protein
VQEAGLGTDYYHCDAAAVITNSTFTPQALNLAKATGVRLWGRDFLNELIENNRIYIKYPEQVFQDDTVIFSYYILEYGEDEIDVYYRQSERANEQLLYHATKKN